MLKTIADQPREARFVKLVAASESEASLSFRSELGVILE
jgi:hypothetical protein